MFAENRVPWDLLECSRCTQLQHLHKIEKCVLVVVRRLKVVREQQKPALTAKTARHHFRRTVQEPQQKYVHVAIMPSLS